MLERIAEARAAGDVDRLCQAIPYARFLGLSAKVVPRAGAGTATQESGAPGASGSIDGDVIVTMKFGPQLVGNPALPALHGGTLGALLESAAIFQLLWASETLLLPKTITITIDYLRSARTVDTHARGIVTRQGRRVANVRVEAWQEDPASPVASAQAHFLIKREE